ncbi:MAG: alpha-glucan family phosphorylase [Armatimonadetes bacterium]|nr:alpha-glucan family phosphorylase [Armatimonadota bacterium]
MKPLQTYHVTPALPEALQPLRALAYNLFWCWHTEVIDLFRRVDRDLWEATGHNPVRMLGEVRQQRLAHLAQDEGFLAQMRRATERLESYVAGDGYVRRGCEAQDLRVAYFSAEFGLTECLPIYSGGLGMLAGDHIKSASDLGVPLAGVGLLYQQGYFRQFLNSDGWQQEQYPENDFSTLPVEPCHGEDGQPVVVEVAFPEGPVRARVWKIQVGRVPVFALDTNIPENPAGPLRDITDQLYGGNGETRLRQEIVLGIGGLRALDKLGQRPSVCHMNEGHAAFLALERIRLAMTEHNLSFAQAREATVAGNVFTTHTPVPAGHDRFDLELMTEYFTAYAKELGLAFAEFMDLGRERPGDQVEPFCMTVLALRLASGANGVSQLHGEVSRKMWVNVWPSVPVEEVPIAHITNGIHARSWVSGDMAELYDRSLGPRWADDPMDRAVWERMEQMPDEELWRTHERRRERLVAFARGRLRAQLERVGAPTRQIRAAGEALDPKVLTIGFARRFATYKRATLLLHDMEHLSGILNAADRPVQIIFAGKAHPADNAGKELIRTLVRAARREDLRLRMAFLEDYDQQVARYLVQGVDVWLNTPLRPLEASGTSGMKAMVNGALNCSVPDGWWPEGYNGTNGWSIGRGESYDDVDYQNEVEGRALYDLLEREIAPLFYERGQDGIPRGWVERVKSSLRTLAPVFNTNRMVLEYTRRFYLPSAVQFNGLNQDERKAALALAEWKARVRAAWPDVQVVSAICDGQPNLTVGDRFRVKAMVKLGKLAPEDVLVQVWHGQVDARDEIVDAATLDLACEGVTSGVASFVGEVACAVSGRQGFAVRVLPRHEHVPNPVSLGLIRWA